jgi:hypothetical protein
MSLPQLIIFYTAFFIVVAIFGFPRIVLRKHKKFTGEEITILRPDLRAIQVKYNAMLLVGCPIFIVLLIAAGIKLEKPAFNEYFLFFTGLLSLGFCDGLFALITGVFPATTRWNWNRFVYDPSGNDRWMAQLQIALAILGTLVGLAMFLFYAG